jgi:hypothetical protein
MHHSVRRYFQNLFIIFTATAAVTLPATIAVQAAENDELHEVETKYIFGHRPASKGKKRSNRKQRPILAKAAVDVTA